MLPTPSRAEDSGESPRCRREVRACMAAARCKLHVLKLTSVLSVCVSISYDGSRVQRVGQVNLV